MACLTDHGRIVNLERVIARLERKMGWIIANSGLMARSKLYASESIHNMGRLIPSVLITKVPQAIEEIVVDYKQVEQPEKTGKPIRVPNGLRNPKEMVSNKG